MSEYVPRLETRKHEPPLTGVEARSLEYKYIQTRCTLKTQVRIKTIAGSDQGERVETTVTMVARLTIGIGLAS